MLPAGKRARRLVLLCCWLAALGAAVPSALANDERCHYYTSLAKLGLVGGVKLGGDTQRPVAAFLNLAYAAAPIGPLRFMPPANWNHQATPSRNQPGRHYELMPGGRLALVREHSQPGASCIRHLGRFATNQDEPLAADELARRQQHLATGDASGHELEDCLIVNVFVPDGDARQQQQQQQHLMRSQLLATHLHINGSGPQESSSNYSNVHQDSNSSTAAGNKGANKLAKQDNLRQLGTTNANQGENQSNGSHPRLVAPIWPLNGPNRLPVLVAFSELGTTANGTGTGSDGSLASNLARRLNSIVVTFNYRTGLLGYLPYIEPSAASSQPDLFASDSNLGTDSASSSSNIQSPPRNNHAIWDQIALLHWLKRNLLAFNGNPANVNLLALDSRASQAIQVLTLSPQAKGLFSRALMLNDGEPVAMLAPPTTASSQTPSLSQMLNLAANANQLSNRLVATLSQIVRRLDIAGSAASPLSSGSLAAVQLANLSQLAKIEHELEQLASESLLALARGPNLADQVLFPQLANILQAHLEPRSGAAATSSLELSLRSLAASGGQQQAAAGGFQSELAYCLYLCRLASNGLDPLQLLAGPPSSVLHRATISRPLGQPSGWRSNNADDSQQRRQLLGAHFDHLSRLSLLSQLLTSAGNGGGWLIQPTKPAEAARQQESYDRQPDRHLQQSARQARPPGARSARLGQDLDQLLNLLGSVELMVGRVTVQNSNTTPQELKFMVTKFSKLSEHLFDGWPIDERQLEVFKFLDFHFVASAWLQTSGEAYQVCSGGSKPARPSYAFHLDLKPHPQEQPNYQSWLQTSETPTNEPLELITEALRGFVHFGDANYASKTRQEEHSSWPSYDFYQRKVKFLSPPSDQLQKQQVEHRLMQSLAVNLDLLPYLAELNSLPQDELALDSETLSCLEEIEVNHNNKTSGKLAVTEETDMTQQPPSCLLRSIGRLRDRLRRLAGPELELLTRANSDQETDSRRQTQQLIDEQQDWPQRQSTAANNLSRQLVVDDNTDLAWQLKNSTGGREQADGSAHLVGGLIELARQKTGASVLGLVVGAGTIVLVLNLTVVLLIVLRSRRRNSQQVSAMLPGDEVEPNLDQQQHRQLHQEPPADFLMGLNETAKARRKSTLKKTSCSQQSEQSSSSQRHLKFDLGGDQVELGAGVSSVEATQVADYLHQPHYYTNGGDNFQDQQELELNAGQLMSQTTPATTTSHRLCSLATQVMLERQATQADLELDLSAANSPHLTSGFCSQSPAANTSSDQSAGHHHHHHHHNHHPSCQHYQTQTQPLEVTAASLRLSDLHNSLRRHQQIAATMSPGSSTITAHSLTPVQATFEQQVPPPPQVLLYEPLELVQLNQRPLEEKARFCMQSNPNQHNNRTPRW